MPKGQTKYFNLMDEQNNHLIIKNGGVAEVAKFLGVNYTTLYDFANLNREIKGYRVSYVKKVRPVGRFYCQNCRALTKHKPIKLDDVQKGPLKLCSQECKIQIKKKLIKANE